MTLNLLLFAVNFTIFLEIEFDFIFYVRYISDEISPVVTKSLTRFLIFSGFDLRDGNSKVLDVLVLLMLMLSNLLAIV